MTRETKLVLVALTAWFCLALLVGISGRFELTSVSVVGLTVWTLTAAALFACWKIPPIRRWTMDVGVAWLIALHLTRLVGIYFLILCQRGELSCLFAKPAGIGDVTTATGAGILLLLGRGDVVVSGKLARPSRKAPAWQAASPTVPRRAWRIAVIVWNIFGLLDILFVVVSAFRVGLNDWHGMAPLRTMPLMLLPTFLVPLIIATHIVIFVRLAKRTDTGRG